MEHQGSYRGFKELNCWQKGRELRMMISKLTKTFPGDERYAPASQITRSVRSINANIAEGYGRYTYTDTRRFFILARGSATETIDHLCVAHEERYIEDHTFHDIEQQCGTVIKLINGYIAYLDKANNEKNKRQLSDDQQPIPNSQ